MRAKGSGGPGRSTPRLRVALTGLPDGTTRLDYDADAMVGGMVGGVGQRVLAGVAKKTAGLFFAAIDDVLTGAVPVQPLSRRAAVPTPLCRPWLAGTGRAGAACRLSPPAARHAAPARVARR